MKFVVWGKEPISDRWDRLGEFEGNNAVEILGKKMKEFSFQKLHAYEIIVLPKGVDFVFGRVN